jgi:NIMA-interacting peptidyl-prolyl cis-trans isomerase 1
MLAMSILTEDARGILGSCVPRPLTPALSVPDHAAAKAAGVPSRHGASPHPGPLPPGGRGWRHPLHTSGDVDATPLPEGGEGPGVRARGEEGPGVRARSRRGARGDSSPGRAVGVRVIKGASRPLTAALLALLTACGGAPVGPTTPAAPAASAPVAPVASAASAAAVPATPPIALDVSGTGMTALGTTQTSGASSADAGAGAAKPDRITARHVLIQYMGAQSAHSSIVRTKDQALTVAQEVLRRARAGDDFARLAVEYSDEPNAGQRGGSLGRFGHGQMVHQFEDAAFGLKVGEISGIIETPFGFHIIQRTE